MRCAFPTSIAMVLAVGGGSAAYAQPVPDYDFQWTTVGNVGNAPFLTSDPNEQHLNGRGTVTYAFRASRLEITTGQWMEFINAFAPFDNSPLAHMGPARWGAERSQQLPNGHWIMGLTNVVPNAAMLPIGGISWRDAARYCNWLHNDKQVALAAISTGAYDTTTWGERVDGIYPDARDRMAGAKFFMPSIDEYLKASHYDPNRFGPNQGGYWEYKTGSDAPPIPGLPGVGTTSAGYQPDGSTFAAWNIPLGAYASVQTSYGLFDVSGGGVEWFESYPGADVVALRPYAGSFAGQTPSVVARNDSIRWINGSEVLGTATGRESFRIYSTVPAPSVLVIGVACMSLASSRRRT